MRDTMNAIDVVEFCFDVYGGQWVDDSTLVEQVMELYADYKASDCSNEAFKRDLTLVMESDVYGFDLGIGDSDD